MTRVVAVVCTLAALAAVSSDFDDFDSHEARHAVEHHHVKNARHRALLRGDDASVAVHAHQHAAHLSLIQLDVSEEQLHEQLHVANVLMLVLGDCEAPEQDFQLLDRHVIEHGARKVLGIDDVTDISEGGDAPVLEHSILAGTFNDVAVQIDVVMRSAMPVEEHLVLALPVVRTTRVTHEARLDRGKGQLEDRATGVTFQDHDMVVGAVSAGETGDRVTSAQSGNGCLDGVRRVIQSERSVFG